MCTIPGIGKASCSKHGTQISWKYNVAGLCRDLLSHQNGLGEKNVPSSIFKVRRAWCQAELKTGFVQVHWSLCKEDASLPKGGIDCMIVVRFSTVKHTLLISWQLDCAAQQSELVLTVLGSPTLGKQAVILSGAVPDTWVSCQKSAWRDVGTG